MTESDYNLVQGVSASNGYSWTKPREAVFKTVTNVRPASMGDIIKKLDGRVDRVSVYRVIDLFE